jgi:hypothetical protein
MLSFLAIFIWIYFFWRAFRFVFGGLFGLNTELLRKNKRINRPHVLHHVYQVLVINFTVMIVVYSLFPKAYAMFLPIEKMDHPLINTFGAMLLKIAIVALLLSQVQIDKFICWRLSEKHMDESSAPELHLEDVRLAQSLLFCFVCIFITLSNFFGLVLCGVAVYLYLKHFGSFFRFN